MKNKLFQLLLAAFFLLTQSAFAANTAENAKKLVDAGNELNAAGKLDDAYANYQQVLNQYGKTTKPELQIQVARALVNSGVVLGKQDKPNQEIDYCNQAIKRFGKDNNPIMQNIIVKAFNNKRVQLIKLDTPFNEQIDHDREMIVLLSGSTNVDVQLAVAQTQNKLAAGLVNLSRSGEATAEFDALIKRIGTSTEALLQPEIAYALFRRGRIFHDRQSLDSAVKNYDEIIKRFNHSSDVYVQDTFYAALNNKAAILGDDGFDNKKNEQAIVLYDEVINSINQSHSSEFNVVLAQAMVNKGIRLFDLSKLTEAKPYFEDVIKRFSVYENADAKKKEDMAKTVDVAQIYADRVSRTLSEK